MGKSTKYQKQSSSAPPCVALAAPCVALAVSKETKQALSSEEENDDDEEGRGPQIIVLPRITLTNI